jgi:ribosomal protein S5
VELCGLFSKLAGVHNILSKSLGSSNKINVAYATVQAIEALVPVDQTGTPTKNKADKKVAKIMKHHELDITANKPPQT